MFTTDGFTVQPLEFPGGNIGSLAVHGTVNDLAVAGRHAAVPDASTRFIEEGLEFATARSHRRQPRARRRARPACVVVAGDTKVVRRGEGGGLYLATTGVGAQSRGCGSASSRDPRRRRDPGERPGRRPRHRGDARARAVRPARRPAVRLGQRAAAHPGAAAISRACASCATRPAAAWRPSCTRSRTPPASACALRRGAHPGARSGARRSARCSATTRCYLACEGRVVAVVAAAEARRPRWRRWQRAAGRAATRRSSAAFAAADTHVRAAKPTLGGERVLDELEDDPLPRIC
ncbi:MAG: hydrogenase expression/formation protein HypE [Chromatiales bacterium]|nr:hydrogenase expression/formation protein HypE [Chromatiales bacterium]